MPPKVTKSKARRSHTLGGCGHCRRRHIKCDQARPACSACGKARLACDGYSSEMRWVDAAPEDGPASDKAANTKVRRQLYTETSRQSMVSALTSQVEASSVAAVLSEIDTRGKTAQTTAEGSATDGPFGIIDFQVPQITPALPVSQRDVLHHQEIVPQHHDSAFQPSAVADNQSSFQQFDMDFSLQWGDLFNLDFEQESWVANDDMFLMDLTPDLPYDAMIDAQPDNGEVTVATLAKGREIMPDFISDKATFLIRHFRDRVIPSMAGLPFGSKSPWKIQNVASAVQTLADITYLENETTNHAKLANLFAIFACSAYQLAAMNNTSEDWASILDYSRHEAKRNLQLSLREELSGPGKVKYKDQLMAMLSVSTIAVISGNKDDARKLIIDTERLLRTRGLSKPWLSRRCRMLHHIYTWTRIIGESTYVLHDYKSESALERHIHGDGTRSSSSEVQRFQEDKEARLDNFLRLATAQEELAATGPKDPDVGLHDIHLDDPREDQATMYDQIYGLPEPWLSLLSRTTKLANVLDAQRLLGRNTVIEGQAGILQKRASNMENMICSFAARDIVGDTTSPNYHMTRALTAALVIYFYRRIRDVNPWIMQSHVDNVISALRDFDDALQKKNIPGPGTAWPAFIAGCEALSKRRRETLSAWLDKGSAQTGLRGFQAANQQMHEVWKRRDDTEAKSTSTPSSASNSSWTWIAVSREHKDWILLC